MESEVATREWPIIFNAEMVRAILEGRKTQTRRVMKPQPSIETTLVEWNTANKAFVPWKWIDAGLYGGGRRTGKPITCPYGVVGDRIWIRESFSYQHGCGKNDGGYVWYWADGQCEYGDWTRPKPSIYMPRWASRLAPVVAEVRVQRVQEISEEDARAEGVECEFYDGTAPISGCYWDYQSKMWSGAFPNGAEARGSFRTLWDSINAKRGFGWEANPWLWVVTFKRVDNGRRG